MRYRKWFAVTVSGVLLSYTAHATDIPQAYINVARVHGIPERILYAIALTESGRSIDGVLTPWPWTLNVQGQGYFFQTRAQMLDSIGATMLQGRRSIDVGAMQINIKYHRGRVNELDEITVPEINLNIASEILLEQYFRCDLNWWCAVGRYHSPGHQSRANAYTERVRQWYDRL